MNLEEELVGRLSEVGQPIRHVRGAVATSVERPTGGDEQREPRAAGYQLIQHGRHVHVAPAIIHHVQVVENEKH